jgi:hypothetical protein
MRAYPGVLVNTLSSTPLQNHLLAQLPREELQSWLPHLEFVQMPLGEVMYEAGATLAHVYFPTTAIVSLLYVMENGSSAEIAVVGNEGIVGVSLFMGGGSTPSRGVVQSAGHGEAADTKPVNRHRRGAAVNRRAARPPK